MLTIRLLNVIYLQYFRCQLLNMFYSSYIDISHRLMLVVNKTVLGDILWLILLFM